MISLRDFDEFIKKHKKIKYYKDKNGCYICYSHKYRKGVGFQFKVKNKAHVMHRYVYEYFFPNENDFYFVVHTCGNNKCINPNHLKIAYKKRSLSDKILRKKERVLNLYKQGYLIKDIMKKSKLSFYTIKKILKKEVGYKLNYGKGLTKLNAEKILELNKDYKSGMKYKDLEKKYGVTKPTILKYLKEIS
jgi:hypothetical protein